jgi:hypothetical protein
LEPRITEREVDNMANQLLSNLSEARDELLREFMLASGTHKAEILAKIIDLDEQLEEVKN